MSEPLDPKPSSNPSAPADEAEQTRQRAEARLRELDQQQQRGPSGSISGKNLVALLATVVILAVGWSHTFVHFWHRWFEAWNVQGLGLWERFTAGQSYYTHGPLVPIASLIIAYLIYRRVGFPVTRDEQHPSGPWSWLWSTRGAKVMGGIVFTGFLSLHLLSSLAQVAFASGFALIGVIFGLLLLWGGWPLFRAYWIPVALLVFMVPLPEVAIADLNFQLKNVASNAAMWVATRVFGIPALLDGSYVYLPPDTPGGEPKTMVVDNVCSGLRSLISLTYFAAMFALVCRVKGPWRILMLLLAAPIAVLCNVIRITGLILMAHYQGMGAAGEGGWFHDLSGLVVFAVALAILFGIEHAIIALSKLLKRERQWVDPRLMGFLESIPRHYHAKLHVMRPLTLGVLALAAVLALMWAKETPSRSYSRVLGHVVPDVVQVNDRTYTGHDGKLDDLTLSILQTPHYLLRQFVSDNQREGFGFLVVFSDNNRKGVHPPDVCLEGSGETIVSRADRDLTMDQVGTIAFRELVTQRGERMTYYLYTYKVGNSYTPSFFSQQMWIFFNGLMGRDASGALIRVTVGIRDRDVEAARQFATDAANTLVPYMHVGLQPENLKKHFEALEQGGESS